MNRPLSEQFEVAVRRCITLDEQGKHEEVGDAVDAFIDICCHNWPAIRNALRAREVKNRRASAVTKKKKKLGGQS